MFAFKLATEIRFFDQISEFLSEFAVNKDDLLVTNRIIYQDWFEQRGLGLNVLFHTDYGKGEPTDQKINKLMTDAHKINYRRVIAVGGGTVLDIAKLLTLQGVTDVLDVLYNKIPIKKDKELIVLPTTCGTGSEVTSITVLEDTGNKVKKGMNHPALSPDYAVLIPELLDSLPFSSLAYSSIDALIHAVESFLAPKSNPITELFSVKAMELILWTYKNIVEKGERSAYENMGKLLLASTYAGIAFCNTGVGAVHALSYPLGGKYHVPHGEANYASFAAVLKKYEGYKPSGKISQLKDIIAEILQLPKGDDVLNTLDNMISNVIPRKRLREYGMQEEEIEVFAVNAMEQERLMNNNYVPLSIEDVHNIYKSLY